MSDGVFPPLENNEALIGLGLFALGLVISGVANRFSQFSLKEELADPASHPELIARYRARGPEAYRRAIARVIGFATRVYGDRLVSGRSIGRCLQIRLSLSDCRADGRLVVL